MTEFTSEFIAELKNIVSKATPTPYYFCVYPDQISETETHPLEGKELKIIACPGDGNHIFGIFAEGEWVTDYFDFVENNAEYIVIACNNLPKALDHIERLQKRVEELEGENSRLSVLLHDEMNQLELTIDLSNKRWIALNNIYTNGEKHNANWCKRKAQEGLGIK